MEPAVDSSMTFGVAYYPEHHPEKSWAQDAARIASAGLDVVRIGEFAWSRLEPAEGCYKLDWLELAITTLAEAGLGIILGTPTAAPPPWLTYRHPEILPHDAMGVVMKPGVRKQYCHSSPVYRSHSTRITHILAERFGANRAVVGWQVDNEFGDHDTARCYCPECRKAFIEWLRRRYVTTAALNDAWGTVFWSQEYSEWEEVDLPYPRREIGLNPSHLLDYYRFSSDQVVSFAEAQVEIIRTFARPEQFVTTNAIATYWEIDFARLALSFDFLSWDCYPVIDATSPVRSPETGPAPPLRLPPSPAMNAMVHDLFRGYSKKPYWVMETLGQDRIVSAQVLSRGGKGVCFFPWKASRFGAEQSRGGFESHGETGRRFSDCRSLIEEIKRMKHKFMLKRTPARIGLLASVEIGWAYDISLVYPRSRWIDGAGYWRIVEEWYESFWRHNIPVDPISHDAEFSRFEVLLVPSLCIADRTLIERLCRYVEAGGILVLGANSGMKDWNGKFIEEMPPVDSLSNLLGCRLPASAASFMPVERKLQMTGESPISPGSIFDIKTRSTKTLGFFNASRPLETVRISSGKPLAELEGSAEIIGSWKVTGKGEAFYFGWSPDPAFFDALAWYLGKKGIAKPALITPDGVEAVRLESETAGLCLLLINHGYSAVSCRLDGMYRDSISGEARGEAIVLDPQSCLLLAPV